jgi:hypothetical protein
MRATMTKPTGRPRGRPRKESDKKQTVRERGRPRIELLSDPDRYAIAAMPVFAVRLYLNQREASLLAVRFFSAPGRPETIRLKARKAWLEIPRPIETIEDLREQSLQPNREFYDGWERRKLWTRIKWLQYMAKVVELVFFQEKCLIKNK